MGTSLCPFTRLLMTWDTGMQVAQPVQPLTLERNKSEIIAIAGKNGNACVTQKVYLIGIDWLAVFLFERV